MFVCTFSLNFLVAAHHRDTFAQNFWFLSSLNERTTIDVYFYENEPYYSCQNLGGAFFNVHPCLCTAVWHR